MFVASERDRGSMESTPNTPVRGETITFQLPIDFRGE